MSYTLILNIIIVTYILMPTAYLFYILASNDRSTDWIENNLAYINDRLKPHEYHIVSLTWYDMA